MKLVENRRVCSSSYSSLTPTHSEKSLRFLSAWRFRSNPQAVRRYGQWMIVFAFYQGPDCYQQNSDQLIPMVRKRNIRSSIFDNQLVIKAHWKPKNKKVVLSCLPFVVSDVYNEHLIFQPQQLTIFLEFCVESQLYVQSMIDLATW